MEIGLITQLSSLGLGAVIAVIVLLWKRGDDARYIKSLEDFVTRSETRDERMLKVIESTTLALQALQKTIETLTVMSHLEKRIAGLEGRVAKSKR